MIEHDLQIINLPNSACVCSQFANSGLFALKPLEKTQNKCLPFICFSSIISSIMKEMVSYAVDKIKAKQQTN